MEAILITLVITAPVIALGTAIFLWGRRHSTPDRMRYRILQAALLVVTAAGVAYVALKFQAQTPLSKAIGGLGPWAVAFAYLANELRRTRNRLKS